MISGITWVRKGSAAWGESVRMLRALGYANVERFHMNEGHAGLLTLELLDEKAKAAGRTAFIHADLDAVRRQCLFTTHTLIPAGHDQFPLDLVERKCCHLLDDFRHFEEVPLRGGCIPQ